MNAGVCRSCGQKILWVRTKRDKMMPLDAEPSAQGNILVEGPPGEEVATVLGKRPEGLFPSVTYLSHFVTCPNSAEHRKGKS